MKMVEIFNVLAQRDPALAALPDAAWREHGVYKRGDGRLVQIPADEKDLPEGFDIAALRAMEKEQADAPLPRAEAFREKILYTEAQAVFDSLASLRSIDFRYLKQACEARTHLMCAALFAQNIIPQKAWAFEGKSRLKVVFPDQSTADWPAFHVAPVIKVVMPGGDVQDYVIDPGLFTGPASLNQWRDAMRAEAGNVEVTAYGEGPRGTADAYQPERPLHVEHDLIARFNVARGNKEAKQFNLPHRQLFEGDLSKNVAAAQAVEPRDKKPAVSRAPAA